MERRDHSTSRPESNFTVRDGFRATLDPAQRDAQAKIPQPNSTDGQRTYLQVDFQQEIRGNLNRNRLRGAGVESS